MIFRILLVGLLAIPPMAEAEAEATAAFAKASPGVNSALASGRRPDVLVAFTARADLAGAEAIADRTARVRFVYDRLRAVASSSQAKAVSILKAKGAAFRPYHITNTILLESADPALVRALSDLKEVSSLTLNTSHALRLPDPPSTRNLPPEHNVPDNVRSVGAYAAWKSHGARGAGIVIGGQDSGYHWEHPALRRQYRGTTGLTVNHNYNWHDSIHTPGARPCPNDGPAPCDDTGHGTHTMGTMIGDDHVSNHIGVAPEAQWIGCRNMLKNVGTLATYLECFEFFLAPYPRGGDPRRDGRPDLAPHIVNNSWACTREEGCQGDELLGAVHAMHAAGILVVAAAGNDGPDCGTVANPPGAYSGHLLSVASFDHRRGEMSFFSSRGPSAWNGGIGIDLSAPGDMIRSAVPPGSDGLYDYKSGTSMAAPHVAGAVALLWSARPALIGKIPETMDLIRRTATPKPLRENCGGIPGNQVPNPVSGYGTLNVLKAIERASAK